MKCTDYFEHPEYYSYNEIMKYKNQMYKLDIMSLPSLLVYMYSYASKSNQKYKLLSNKPLKYITLQ